MALQQDALTCQVRGQGSERARLVGVRNERLDSVRSGLWLLLQATDNPSEHELLLNAIQRVNARRGRSVVHRSSARLRAEIAAFPAFVARITHCRVALVDGSCRKCGVRQLSAYVGAECSRVKCPRRAQCSYETAQLAAGLDVTSDEEMVAAK